MKRLAAVALGLGLAACSESTPPAPASAPGASKPASTTPLKDPAHPEATKAAPAEYRVRFTTSRGDFALLVKREWAPLGADRFYNLVRMGFYDHNRFFRVVPGFVVQWGLNGEPQVSAAWKEAKIPDDPAGKQTNARGTITFATSGPNSRTTQVFINFADNPRLDGMGFAPFGRVIAGMDVVDALNAEYREQPDQVAITAQGNAYLMDKFIRLDYILKATLAD
jgi:peptidyl-prolyl cis-trans isomerase A (cyclophilin A)